MRVKITKSELEAAIDGASSIKDVIVALGRPVNNGGYSTIRRVAKEYELELPVFDTSTATKRANSLNKMPDNEFFTNGKLRNGVSIRKRLTEDQGVADLCVICGLGPEWNGRPLTLQVDHINGDRFDNRIENLRIVCPNCHTQTETYGNNSKSVSVKYNYCKCGARIAKVSTRCRGCSIQSRPSKIEWPSREDVEAMVLKTSYAATGRALGVSDNAVRAFLKRSA